MTTQTTATLSGRVNPDGQTVTECKFEYGTSTSYGASASCKTLPGSGSSPVEVSAKITALTPNTEYHFRIVTKNAGGTIEGPDVTFKTLKVAAPAVETKAASAVGQTTATLNASVNPRGGALSTCRFEYGTTTGYGSSAPCATLPGSPDALISQGRYWVSTAEAAELTGVPAAHVYPGLQRLRRRGAMFSPARGFHVVIPAEYRSWGVLPGELFIDGMMRALGRDYYVSLLTAAAMHGAAHQAPQVFQVMVDRHVADRDIERVRLRFYANEHLGEMATEERQVDTGRIRLATRETTLVDLIVHPDDAGGLSNIATVAVEIGDLDVPRLAQLAAIRSRSVARRLGWLLSQFRNDLDLEPLRKVALAGGDYPTRLVRSLPARGPIDPRWNLQVNSDVEPDL